MGALDRDTQIEGESGEYRARLSRDWEIWGPNGGYVAAIALRAAGLHTAFTRPASFTGHFLGVADFDEVQIAVRSLRRTKRAESLAVSMTQDGRPVHEAVVWAVEAGLEGIEHELATMPDVAAPETLPSLVDRLPSDAPIFRFWQSLESRPVEWIDDWENRPPGNTRRSHLVPLPPDTDVRGSVARRRPLRCWCSTRACGPRRRRVIRRTSSGTHRAST